VTSSLEDEAIRVLLDIEWKGQTQEGCFASDEECPSCMGKRRKGHEPTCDLLAVLEQAGVR